MIQRREFLTSALIATAAGVLVPEWIIDPPKGRSMVTVPAFKSDLFAHALARNMKAYIKITRIQSTPASSFGSHAMKRRVIKEALGGFVSDAGVNFVMDAHA